MLLNKKEFGIIGGDWNSIIAKNDCNTNPEVKMSPCFSRLVRILELSEATCNYSIHDGICNNVQGVVKEFKCPISNH